MTGWEPPPGGLWPTHEVNAPRNAVCCQPTFAGSVWVGEIRPSFGASRLSDEDVERIATRVAELAGGYVQGIRTLHDQVDQTDPACPVGTALSRAGLQRRP